MSEKPRRREIPRSAARSLARVIGLGAGVLTASLAASGPAPPSYTQVTNTPTPRWRVLLEREPSWIRWTQARVLLVGDSSRIVGLDERTGGEIWRRDGLRHPVIRFAEPGLIGVSDGPVDARRRVWIHARDGSDVADSATVRRAEAGVVDTDEPRLRDTDSTRVRRRDERAVRQFLESGAILWESPRLEPGARLACVAVGDATPVERERRDTRPMLARVPFLMSRDGRRLFLTNGNTVFALDPSDGHALWPVPRELCGRPVEIRETTCGVLIRTMHELRGNDELVMLATGTGRPIWRYPGAGAGTMLTSDLELGNLVVEEPWAFLLAGRQLMRVGLADGSVRVLGKAWIQEYDRHVRLERVGRRFVLTAGQEMEWLDDRGRSVRRIEIDPVPGQRETLAGVRVLPNTYPDSVAFLLADSDPTDLMPGPLLVGISKSTGEVVRRIPVSPRPLCDFHPEGPVFVVSGRTVNAFVP